MTNPAPTPSLSDLATACQGAHDAYTAAQATAAGSAAQAQSDAAAATTAHQALDAAISDLIAAAQAEDPNPPGTTPAPAASAKK